MTRHAEQLKGGAVQGHARSRSGSYVRGQYEGYRELDGVAADSTTETFAALRLEIDNWRWSGVPFLIRAGQALAGYPDRTASGVPGSASAGLWLVGRSRCRAGSDRDQAGSGDRPAIQARCAAGRKHRPEAITLDMTFAAEGGEGPTPYEVLLHAALVGAGDPVYPAGWCGRNLADHAAVARRTTSLCSPTPRLMGPAAAERPDRRYRRMARAWMPG